MELLAYDKICNYKREDKYRIDRLRYKSKKLIDNLRINETVNSSTKLAGTNNNEFHGLIIYFLENGNATVVDGDNNVIEKILIWYAVGYLTGHISAYFNINCRYNDEKFIFFNMGWYIAGGD